MFISLDFLYILIEQRTISPILTMFSFLYAFFLIFISFFSHLQRHSNGCLLEELTTGGDPLGATFFEGCLGLGRIPFLRYYGGVLYPPQGFRCEV